ncbi:MAG: hypothetical protein ACI9G1_005536 [Pirellulaceae bacterium]|jgi:hypothetical protein
MASQDGHATVSSCYFSTPNVNTGTIRTLVMHTFLVAGDKANYLIAEFAKAEVGFIGLSTD